DRSAVEAVAVGRDPADGDGRLDRPGVAVDADDVDRARRVHARGPDLLVLPAAGAGVEAALRPGDRALARIGHRRVPGDALLLAPGQEFGALGGLQARRGVAVAAAVRTGVDLGQAAVAVGDRDVAGEVDRG